MIHVVGDSHCSLFSGQDNVVPQYPERSDDKLSQFRTYRLGAVLAFNLLEYGHTSQGRERLEQCLAEIPMHETIMLIFGEIDVRTQLIKQARLQKKSQQMVVLKCVERYFTVIHELAQTRPILVWNAPPQSMSTFSSNKFPTVGTGQERNKVARLFNRMLAERCEKHKIPFISIFDHVVDADNVSNMGMFMDSAHLSQKALPFALKALESYL